MERHADRSDSAAYVLCALTEAVGVTHILLLRRWPGWSDSPPPNLFAYAIQFQPVAAILFSIVAAVLNRRGYGTLALKIVIWCFVPAVCVLLLDGCIGTIGMVD